VVSFTLPRERALGIHWIGDWVGPSHSQLHIFRYVESQNGYEIYTEILIRYFPGGAERNYDNLGQDDRATERIRTYDQTRSRKPCHYTSFIDYLKIILRLIPAFLLMYTELSFEVFTMVIFLVEIFTLKIEAA
jgi:hypothetical protein